MPNEPILGGFVTTRPNPIIVKSGDVVGLTLMSDIHIGAPYVDYKKVAKEIQVAKDRGDWLLFNGDLYDAILVQDKKRFTGESLHPRLQNRNNILNEAVQWGTEMLAPVVDRIIMIGVGNHEFAVEKHHNYDPIQATIYELEKLLPKNSKHTIHHGGVTGFVDFRFRYANPSENKRNEHGRRFVLYYHHGSGGAAPVTKGMIDFNRKAAWVNADLIWMGHKHNRLNDTYERIECPLQGEGPTIKEVRNIMTGAYGNCYVGQSQKSIREHGRKSNYVSESGFAPQGKGGARVELAFGPVNEQYQIQVIQ